MILYAESSAVLNWLFDESRGLEVSALLEDADRIFASDLTLVECERSSVREMFNKVIAPKEHRALIRTLRGVAEQWNVIELSKEILDRVRQPFPEEPLRTLDAIHVASALACRQSLPEIGMLSLDDRVRRSTAALGFEVVPYEVESAGSC